MEYEVMKQEFNDGLLPVHLYAHVFSLRLISSHNRHRYVSYAVPRKTGHIPSLSMVGYGKAILRSLVRSRPRYHVFVDGTSGPRRRCHTRHALAATPLWGPEPPP